MHSKTTKMVALGIIVFSTIVTIPAYVSGEEAEHRVENLPGMSKSIMEEHEESAELAFVLIEITGALAFISFLLNQTSHKLSVWSNRITWAGALVSIVLLVNVGRTGGQIRRPELREANVAAPMNEHEEHHE
jgi:hypothetical protein